MNFLLKVCTSVLLVLFISGSSPVLAQPGFFEFLQNQGMGKPAVDFTLKNLKGESVNMTKYRDGKRAIIFFWATWCPHCREAITLLNQSHGEIEKKGIKIILVDVGEESKEVAAHVKSHKIDMDVLVDENNSLSEPYNIVGVPTFYFVDEKGLVQAVKHSLPKNYESLFTKAKM